MLPPSVWQELCHAHPAQRFALHMVGPGVGEAPSWAEGDISVTCHRGFYHELARVDPPAGPPSDADLVVCFNPGFAAAGWARAWEPTVRALLSSRAPMVCTGLDDRDTEACRGFVHGICAEMLGQASVPRRSTINPFASLRPTVSDDSSPDCAVLWSNHSLFTVHHERGAGPDGRESSL